MFIKGKAIDKLEIDDKSFGQIVAEEISKVQLKEE